MKTRWGYLVIALVTILALGLCPAPAYAQAAGRPILTIRNYRVEPTPVKAGQEFTVEIEIYNNGSRAGENTMAVFPGGSFLPVGETGHVLWQLHINHTAVVQQQMRAPATLSSGVHSLSVSLSANDYEGNHYEYPQTIPIEIVGEAPKAPLGSPRVIVERATTEPEILVPGAPFTLTMRLTNEGARSAVRLSAGCAVNELAVPTEGSGIESVGQIAVGEIATVTLPLMLSWDVEQGGRHSLPIDLAYEDYGGGTYKDQQMVGVEIDAGMAARPRLLIDTYQSDPPSPMPGDTFTLSLRLCNTGNESARRVSVAFGGIDGAGLDPLLLLDAGHVFFAGDLGPGEEMDIIRRLAVDGTAAPKAYQLPLTLSYDDGRGTRSESVQLNLLVQSRPVRRPQLVLTAYHTDPKTIAAGETFELQMELSNVGSGDAERLTVALGGVDGGALEPFLPIGRGNVLSIGALPMGQMVQVAQSLIVDGAATAKAYNLPVALTYAGPEGERVTEIQRLSLIVRQRVELVVDIYSRPDRLSAGAPAEISLEVLNVGRGAVDVVGMKATGTNMEIETEGAPFVGPLDPGGSAPLDVTVTPTRGGAVQLAVHIEYRDDLNQVQIASQSLTLDVADDRPAPGPEVGGMPPAEEAAASPALWKTALRAVRGFLGFGS